MMWKIVTLSLLATAAAFPQQLQDVLSPNRLLEKLGDSKQYKDELGQLEKNCKKYGSKDAYTNLMKSVDQAYSKFFSSISYEFGVDLGLGKVSNYVALPCRIITNASNQKQEQVVFDSYVKCVNPKHRETYKSMVKSYDNTVKFVCGNQGINTVNLIQEGGGICLFNHSTEIGKCISEFEKGDNFDAILAQPQKYCRALSTTKTCVMKVVSKCSKQSVSKYMESVFTSLNIPKCH